METIKLEIKENSVNEFVKNYVIVDERDYERGPGRDVINPYHVLGRDQFLCRKSLLEISGDDKVIKISLSDRGRESNSNLVNTYVYEISDYDLLAVKLVLVDFKVELR